MGMSMNPKIKELIEELRDVGHDMDRTCAAEDTPPWRAASILQAVFDPENQPSQYGTTLTERSV